MKGFRAGSIAVGLVLLTAASAAGQATVMVRGGVSVATFGGDDSEGTSSRTGVNVGAAVSFGLGSNLGVQIGGAYVQKGADVAADDADAGISIDYIEVPVLLQVTIPTEGPIAPRFFAGPAVSFEASCEVDGTLEGITVSADCSDADIETKSIDIGALGGAGLSIATAGDVSVTLDVMYNLGLRSIDDAASPDDVKNRAWSFLAGVALPLG